MDRILELLARLNDLSADERTELRGLITAEAATLAGQERTPDVVAQLGELADGLDSLTVRETVIAEEQAALDAQADAALARLNPAPEVDEEAAAAEAAVVAEAEAAAAAAAPEPVAAAAAPPARPSLRAAAAARPAAAATRPVEEAPAPRGASLTASADVPGLPVGHEFGNLMELAEAFERRRAQIGRSAGGDGEQVIVASARYDFPEERRLSADDANLTTRRIREALDTPEVAAMVAAGGLCAPLENIYDIDVIGVTDRPVQASLPGFNATRGGVSLRPSPVFTDFNGATGIWTMANDVSPSAPATKPVIEVLCQAFEQFTVDAVTMRLRFHNITSRFDPEGTAANIQAAMVAHARLAENELLNKMYTLCKTMSHPAAVSATRDLLVMMDQTIAYYKWRHRVGDGQVLHMWAPRWAKDLIRADIARGPLYDRGILALADAEIESWFRARNINITWHLDGRTASADLDPGVGTFNVDLQGYADVTTLGAVPGFPNTIEVVIADEADFLYLDGGELDLGVVRDITSNSVNEYQTFTETFEGIASRGNEAIRAVATVQPTGSYSLGQATTSLVD